MKDGRSASMEDTQGIHIFSTQKSNSDAIWEDRIN